MKLNESFNQQEFTNWISSFLPDFSQDVRNVDVSKSFQGIKSIQTIGESSLGVRVYIIETEQDPSRRKVSLAKESFTLLRDYGTPNAIIAYHCNESTFWRLSLLTSTLSWDEGKINKKLSNPKRQSYILGSKAKVKTPHQYLITKGSVVDIKDLKNRFSLEVVNKEFYKEISHAFIDLVGGTLTKGKSKEVVKPKLKLPSVGDHSQTAQEFVVRLIGRVIFSWFLREKKSSAGHSLMPHDLLSLDASKSTGDYYHTILEPIFFEVLNKKINSRKETYTIKPFADIPYLNGGLFAPHDDDHYSYNDGKQAINHNLVVIPDSWFTSFFEILETYNFTIDENTSFDEELSIDPEMLGRIFENLLAEINPETGESARKSTGSYYTPRVIVDYMVDESLYLYLKDKTGIPENKLRSVISYDLDDDSHNPLTDNERDKITQALQSVKILDPACGSGAFPIGALQKIVFILQQIDPHGQIWFNRQIQNTSVELRRLIQKEFEEKNFDYLRKLGVIRENIYGVDIQPIATEISRLRCFLTLVVDQRVDDTLPNRGIEPLPNLDFKFVTANTLIGLPKTEVAQGGLFEDHDNIDKLSEVRSLYFSASSEERAELKNKFVEIQNDMLNTLVREHRPAELTEKLATWKPFSHQQTTWFDPDWMFGIKNGFDIVIANPPYVGNKGHKDEFQKIQDGTLGKYYQRRMDIFYFFIHLGLDVCANNGLISLITTNYYLTATSGATLRKHMLRSSTFRNLINFNELKIFESALGQHNAITIIQKNKNDDILLKSIITSKTGAASSEILTEILNGSATDTVYNKIAQKDIFDGDEYYIRQSAHSGISIILDKIQKNNKVLGQLCNVNQGIVSGADKISKKHLEKFNLKAQKGDGIFILNKNELLEYNIDASDPHVKPWYKNSDIGKYWANNQIKEYVLYFKDNKIKQPISQSILNHFNNYKDLLIARLSVCKKNKFQWNIVSKWLDRGEYYLLFYPRKQEIFEKPKIIAPQRSTTNTFGYSETSWYAASDVFFITEKNINIPLKYVLALINSKLYFQWLFHRGKRKGKNLELTAKPLSEIPIKEISESEQQPFIKLVDQILSITSRAHYDPKNPPKEQKELEAQIDILVYKLYGLTEEEIKLVESS